MQLLQILLPIRKKAFSVPSFIEFTFGSFQTSSLPFPVCDLIHYDYWSEGGLPTSQGWEMANVPKH